MSARFIVKFQGAPIRFFPYDEAKVVFEALARDCADEATPFTSMSEGWVAVRKYRLNDLYCEVVPAEN